MNSGYGCTSWSRNSVNQPHRAISGVKWSSVSQAVRLASQLIGVFVLARLLPASDFGLMAIATVVAGFANLFRDMGTAAAVIQRKQLSPQLLDSIFWFNVAVGLALSTSLILLAPLIARMFDEPRLAKVLVALAGVFLLACLGAVQQALLERDSQFRSLALLESVAAIIGSAIAIGGASAGWGVYSLVSQTLASTAVTNLALWSISDWRPKTRGCLAEIRGLVQFSGNLVGFNVFNYFARNADNLLIGLLLGAHALGLYSMAYKLMLWPIQNISAVMARALLPTFSRLQERKDRFGTAFVQVSTAIIFITAPLMSGAFVLRDPLVILALGESWKPVADLLFWLAPVGLLQSVSAMAGLIYVATGRTDVMFKWGVIKGLLDVCAIASGLRWGIEGVAIAYFSITLLVFIPSFLVPFRLIGLKLADLMQHISRPFLISTAMGGIVYVSQLMFSGDIIVGARFAILVISGALSYLVLSMAFQRRLVKRIYSAVVR